jgi:hypothetical protein
MSATNRANPPHSSLPKELLYYYWLPLLHGCLPVPVLSCGRGAPMYVPFKKKESPGSTKPEARPTACQLTPATVRNTHTIYSLRTSTAVAGTTSQHGRRKKQTRKQQQRHHHNNACCSSSRLLSATSRTTSLVVRVI